MALVEDFSSCLADSGVPCSKGGVSFTAFLDTPDNAFDIGGSPIQSTEYSLTYLTSSITLVKGDAVTVKGLAYLVRSSDNLLDDGYFSAAKLSKV